LQAEANKDVSSKSEEKVVEFDPVLKKYQEHRKERKREKLNNTKERESVSSR